MSAQQTQQAMQFQQQMNEQMMMSQAQQPPAVQNMGDVINSAEGQKRFDWQNKKKLMTRSSF